MRDLRMNNQVDVVRRRISGRLWRLALVMTIAFTLVLPGVASQAIAKGGGKAPPEDPLNPFRAWEIEDDYWMGLYGVKATINVVDPTITDATKSLVAYSVSAIIGGNSWLQIGYLEGWYLKYGPGGAVWMEATVPTVYFEYFDGDSGSHSVNVLWYLTPEIGSEHTFTIYWDWLTYEWEWYYDDRHLASAYWVSEISADCLTIQGECYDTDDRSNGIVKFTDVQYLRYDIFGGRICNPHWELWEHPADDWGFDWPWWSVILNDEELWVWIDT